MADSRQKWQEACRAILAGLDIAAEYRALGLRISNAKPSAKGWVPAHSADVDDDRNPSAGINVVDGPLFGRYKDFRSGRSCTLFDFAAPRFGGDWRQARNHYARQAGVKLPEGEEELPADRLDLYDPTTGTLVLYAAGKPGVTARALKEVGARGARWPKGLTPERSNYLLAVPMYGASLLDLEPTAWHCVAQNPRLKIRKYQGKDNQEAHIKTMTLGEYGLMNEDGLSRLAEAEVVNIVEGLSDLLAAQAVLGPWRDESPGDRRHVVLSAGGCTYHPQADWMPHFAGKEVRIWFDVGDQNNEGQVGAAVWATALLSVAKTVRNVLLPTAAGGGKNDLRAWLVAGGRGYAEMDEYAGTFEPTEPSDEAARVTSGDAILKCLDLLVLGEHEGSQRIEVFSGHAKKAASIGDIDKLSITKLVQLVGQEAVDQYVHDGREVPAGKFDLKSVRNAIANAAHNRLYASEDHFGAGVWQCGDKIVLVRSGEVGILDEKITRAERSHVPYLERCALDIGQTCGAWYDLGTLNRYLLEAQKDTWCMDVFDELCGLIGKWHWKYRSAAKVTTLLTMASWVQTLWEWRPQVFITGASQTGKSSLLNEVLAPLFGKLAMVVQKPTEASIRQHMEHHAKVLFVDEFEESHHRQRVFDLFRTSSRGGVTIRGSANHRAVKFRVRHLPWFSAIEPGLHRQADWNRFIILELGEIPEDKFGQIRIPPPAELAELGIKLLAVALRCLPAAKAIAKELRSDMINGVPGRVVENFAVCFGLYGALCGGGIEFARDQMRDLFREWDFGEQTARDDVNVLQEILTTEFRTDIGRQATVTKLLSDTDEGSIESLSRIGIRRLTPRSGPNEGSTCIWVCPLVVKKNLMHRSEYTGQSIGQYLRRLKGARTSRQRLGGRELFHGVEIPMASLEGFFYDMGNPHAEPQTVSQLEY